MATINTVTTKITTRKIKTNTFSKKAKEMLRSVIGQMSDGTWENSKSMEKYWMFATIERALDGENIIEIGVETGRMYCHRYVNNGFSKMTDDQIREFFAKKIKQIAKIELKDNDKTTEWKRNNTEFKSCYLNYNEDISIADAYLCYEFLLGRNLSHWTIDQIKNIVGVKRSDKEIQIAEKKNELYNKYVDMNRSINTEYDKKIEEIKAKMNAEIAKLKEERDVKLSENRTNYVIECDKLTKEEAAA